MTGSRQLVLAVAILGSLYATASIGAGRESLSDKIEKERKTLDQLKDQIEEKRKQADEAGKKRDSVLQGLQSLDERLVENRQAHQDILRKLQKKDQEI